MKMRSKGYITSAKPGVCHISTVHQPSDDRIFYKECVSLARHGYRVSFVVPAAKNETRNGVSIIAVPQYNNRLTRVIAGPVIAFFKGLGSGAKLIHFHDPELILMGLVFKLLGRKVIYDVHELVYYHFDQKHWLSPSVRQTAKYLYRFTEKLAVRFFDRIILVVDDDRFRSYFFDSYPQHTQKFLFIRNYSMLGFIDSIVPAAYDKTCSILIYAGGLSRERGIREVIRATDICKQKTELLLFGSWSDEKFHEECKAESGWKNVKDMGYRRLEEVYPWMKISDLGLAVLYPETNYLTSLPVKLFEYMTCSVPALMSEFPFWKKIFGECAFFVDPMNADDIAAGIDAMLGDKEKLRRMGEAGRKLVEEKYSWEAEAKRLTDCYDGLLLNDKD